MPRKAKNLKAIQKKSLKLQVTPTSASHTFGVTSGSNPKVEYLVTFAQGYETATCTCEWIANGGDICCHVMAAVRYLAAQNGHRVSFWATEADARRQKKRRVRLNDIWVTVRKREKKQEGLATYVCPECGEEYISEAGREDLACRDCWFEQGYKRVICQPKAA